MQISNFNNLELGVKKLKKNNVTLASGCQESIHGILQKTLHLPGLSRKHSWDNELKCYPCLG